MNAESLEILRKVKSGEISAREGADRLDALELAAAWQPVEDEASLPEAYDYPPAEGSAGEDARAAVHDPSAAAPTQVEEITPNLGGWENAWLILFGAGIGIFVIGAIVMGWAYTARSSFWFSCSWLPMVFGMSILFLGWWSRQAHWVHVRVQKPGAEQIIISAPLPLRLAGWILRVVRPFVPKLREQHLDILPMIFDAMGSLDEPIFVEVNEKDGERVLIYIR